MIDGLFKSCLKNTRAAKVLDIGPGYSSFALLASQLTGATEIIALDYNPEVLNFQRRQCAAAGISCTCIQGLATEEMLRMIPQPVDLILCQEILEHIPNPIELVRLLPPMLSRNGRIIITVPTRCSEQLLSRINPAYMKDEPHGHVTQFDERSLRTLLGKAGLRTELLYSAQPHYFLAHCWLFGSRMQVEAATGRILTGGWRMSVYNFILRYSRAFFRRTGDAFWARVFPRNYFVLAARAE